MEKAVLVGIFNQLQPESVLKEHLDELAFLAETAGAKTLKRFIQKMNNAHKSTFVGKGKLEEIVTYIEIHEIDLLIFDEDLTPSQLRNIEKEVKIKVLDRSMLILDIFATRAKTAQARTQVELAQTQYLLPRLRGMWEHLDRQKGGIGMRGAGEKEIETDRRVANQRISLLKKKLEKIDLQNATRRKSRGEFIRVSLVGYTNVGKSTIMRVLSKSDVFAENKLFATLDTTVKKVVLETTPFLLSDTVGFIRKLPHHLVESFKSTLDEVREADIILHVVDLSHDAYPDQIKTVQETLNDIGIQDKTTIMVFNKIDAYFKKAYDEYLNEETKNDLWAQLQSAIRTQFSYDCAFISAIEKQNIADFRAQLLTSVQKAYSIRYPYRSKMFG